MTFNNSEAGCVVLGLIETIQKNTAYLSEIDGLIGDGDHGINMNKGFTLCKSRLNDTFSLSEGLHTLSTTLMEDIGGSMGPLYGILFFEMAEACAYIEAIDSIIFEKMLTSAIAGIEEIGSAKKGDKTLLDTLIPAKESYSAALAEGKNFIEALDAMKNGARQGWESTKEMIAKVGRASRLGERSRGVLDAGATSCFLLLSSMADTMSTLIK